CYHDAVAFGFQASERLPDGDFHPTVWYAFTGARPRAVPICSLEFGRFYRLRLPEGDMRIARQFTAGF
ncbi:MAG: hypothetical protein O2960_22375, partial [Verrucomicrobia bacterium]|nr:hypothetical protein [Verrucomicrobiota bacterium]